MVKNEKYAVVTGASSGIGLAFARVLAGKGYALVMVSNEDEALKARAAEIASEFGGDALPLNVD